MARVIIHSVGTSLLTNLATEELRKRINQLSNHADGEIGIEDKRQMDNLLKSTLAKTNTIQEGGFISAELAGLNGFYTDNPGNTATDIHFLIHTDTYAGTLCASYLAQLMEKLNLSAINKIKIENLTTRNKQTFQRGIKWLINWCEDILPGYHATQYKIIFNLTGGFKSLQGYLNIIGMFYADKVVYKFETGNELIEIPRLPIRLDSDVVRNAAPEFLLANYGICHKDQLPHIPSVYLDEDEDLCTLSPIGKLVWNRNKTQILQEKLIELPYLRYEDSFTKDFKNRDRDPIKLQETLAKISSLLANSNGDTALLKKDGGLQYENFQNKQFSGLPIGHFRVSQETRVSCIARDGYLFLRHFGGHDYVNSNP